MSPNTPLPRPDRLLSVAERSQAHRGSSQLQTNNAPPPGCAMCFGGGRAGGGGCRGMAPVQRYGTKEAAGFALAQSVAFDPPTHPPGWGKTAHPPPTRFRNSVQPCLKGFFTSQKSTFVFHDPHYRQISCALMFGLVPRGGTVLSTSTCGFDFCENIFCGPKSMPAGTSTPCTIHIPSTELTVAVINSAKSLNF